MIGRVIIITGVNLGIGYDVVKKLCEVGNDVILVCRDEVKGKVVVENIFKENFNVFVIYF